jgi:hypothetical protein
VHRARRSPFLFRGGVNLPPTDPIGKDVLSYAYPTDIAIMLAQNVTPIEPLSTHLCGLYVAIYMHRLVLAIQCISTVCTQLYRIARGGGNDQEQESFWSQRAAAGPQAPK